MTVASAISGIFLALPSFCMAVVGLMFLSRGDTVAAMLAMVCSALFSLSADFRVYRHSQVTKGK